jgi:type IV pilus assembly protein PilA
MRGCTDPRGEFTLKKFHNRKGGFTLIELMIVVAIIGILAAIAIPNFLRFQLKAKSSEGKTNIAAIRTAEQSYYSEFGTYVSADGAPAAVGQNQKTTFSETASAGMDFNTLGWSPEGQVYFSYGVNANMNGYTVSASADIDGDNTYQAWGYKKLNGTADVPAMATAGLTCAQAFLTTQVVGPCAASFGQSVF